MPNWCTNRINLNNLTDEEIATFITTHIVNNEFDYNTVIKSPQTKEDCPKEFLIKGNVNIELEEKRPWFNWYDWNYKNWDVKWNACNTERFDDYTISFDSPWGPPYAVLKKLTTDNPKIIATFVDEGESFAGKVENGVVYEYTEEDEIEKFLCNEY